MAEGIRWDWIARHAGDIAPRTVEHIQLVSVSVAIAAVIAIPVAVAVRGRPVAFGVATGVTGLLYTIPSLALFAFLVPITGIGKTPVIIGLVVYSLLILIRNTVVGLQGVPAPVLEAARGMGLTRRQTLLRVELPLALPAIIAGARIATVSAVGIATIGAFVEGGGLGKFILQEGISRDLFLTPILLGSVAATVLAILFDLALLFVERALTPWTRRRAAVA